MTKLHIPKVGLCLVSFCTASSITAGDNLDNYYKQFDLDINMPEKAIRPKLASIKKVLMQEVEKAYLAGRDGDIKNAHELEAELASLEKAQAALLNPLSRFEYNKEIITNARNAINKHASLATPADIEAVKNANAVLDSFVNKTRFVSNEAEGIMKDGINRVSELAALPSNRGLLDVIKGTEAARGVFYKPKGEVAPYKGQGPQADKVINPYLRPTRTMRGLR